MTAPKYNQECMNPPCGGWRREDDYLCRKCYFKVPQEERWRLWRSDGATKDDLRLIYNLIDETERGALVDFGLSAKDIGEENDVVRPAGRQEKFCAACFLHHAGECL